MAPGPSRPSRRPGPRGRRVEAASSLPPTTAAAGSGGSDGEAGMSGSQRRRASIVPTISSRVFCPTPGMNRTPGPAAPAVRRRWSRRPGPGHWSRGSRVPAVRSASRPRLVDRDGRGTARLGARRPSRCDVEHPTPRGQHLLGVVEPLASGHDAGRGGRRRPGPAARPGRTARRRSPARRPVRSASAEPSPHWGVLPVAISCRVAAAA